MGLLLAPLGLAALALLGLAALALLGGSRSRALGSLRVLLPSWRFFDSVAQPLLLLVRTGAEAGELGGYRELLPPARRTLGSLFINAEGNLRLLYYSLMEQLLQELSDLPDGDSEAARRLVTYELLLNLVRASLGREPRREVARFQFKLQLMGSQGVPGEDLLISELHAL